MASPYQIGDYEMLWIDGACEPVKPHVVLVARPGVVGVGIWRDAGRGVQFRVRTGVDCEDLEAGEVLYQNYHDLVYEDPVAMVWAGLKLDNADGPDFPRPYKVSVLQVTRVRLTPLLLGVGGLNPPSRALLECDWDLVALAAD